jgi:hypothetical protein
MQRVAGGKEFAPESVGELEGGQSEDCGCSAAPADEDARAVWRREEGGDRPGHGGSAGTGYDVAGVSVSVGERGKYAVRGFQEQMAVTRHLQTIKPLPSHEMMRGGNGGGGRAIVTAITA